MDSSTRDRLTKTVERLRAALAGGHLPSALTETAQRCLIDMDGALANDLSNGHGCMLLAQAQALLTVAGQGRRADRDANEG